MRLMLLLSTLLLLAGCAPSESQLRMEMDLEEMKRRLGQLQIQQAETKSSGFASGDTQQRQVAELTAGLDNLRVELQSINGRLDDMGRENQSLVDEVQLIKDDLGLQIGSLTERVDQLELRTVDLAEKATAVIVPTVQAPPEPAKSAEQIYQQALDMIRKENRFAEGREQLEQFVKTYPQHDLVVNALYWSGEALYGEKKYEMSILQLQDVISKYASHPKAAAAMFKQALAFNALGDPQNAKTTMQKLIEEYPDAEQVKNAKKFLEQ